MSTNIVAKMKRDKTTKNAVRYTEEHSIDGTHFKALYLTKTETAQLGNPEVITVTISSANETN